MSTRGRKAWASALFAFSLAAGCNGCPTTNPPEIPTVCWQHSGPASYTCCSGASETEPNDNVRRANPVPDATCGEATAQTLAGALGGDVDVFRTSGARCDGSKPTVTLTTLDPTIRVCLFASCQTGKTGLTGCSPGAVPTHLPEGMLGCCFNPVVSDAGTATATGPSEVSLDVDCDADVQFGALTPLSLKPPLIGYLVVDGAPPDACTDYQIAYHY